MLSFLYLRCLEAGQAEYVLSEIHQGIYNNHYGVSVSAHKALRQRYYWPTMHEDANKMVRSCDKGQRLAKVTYMPPKKLIMTS